MNSIINPIVLVSLVFVMVQIYPWIQANHRSINGNWAQGDKLRKMKVIVIFISLVLTIGFIMIYCLYKNNHCLAASKIEDSLIERGMAFFQLACALFIHRKK